MASARAADRADPKNVPRRRSLIEHISWLIVALTTISVPLVLSPSAKDSFRVPKELLFKASGIVLLALAICEVFIDGRYGRKKDWSPPVAGVIAAVLIWCTVITITSTNPILSLQSLVWVAAAIVFFVAAYRGARGRSLSVLYFVLAPAVVNALIAIAQRTTIWTPIKFDEGHTGRLATTALLGNPDDVGMFLTATTVAAGTLALISRGRRWKATSMMLILIAAIVASESASAIVAVFVGLFLLVFLVRPRAAIIGGALCLLLAGLLVRITPQRWSLTQSKIASAARGDVDPLLSGRLPAFLAAWRMFQHHPIFGVGLGCFSFQYFDEKIAVEMEHPWLSNRSVVNFGEVHNEHLQMLAEGGLPAYAIFLAAFVVMALVSFRGARANPSDTAGFAGTISLPLAASIFTLTLSSFPLHLAAATTNILFLSAVTMSWSQHARS
jgi:O-antigen ligase